MYKVTFFSKLVKLIPRNEFRMLTEKYQGDYYTKKLTTWTQLLVHLYSAVSGKGSIRPLLDGFNSMRSQFYHLNVKASVKRSTFSDANQLRSCELFKELFETIYCHYASKLPRKVKLKINKQVKLIDSTYYTLSSKLSAWAYEGRKKINNLHQGMRLHFVIDANRSIPQTIVVKPANTGDLCVAKTLSYQPGEIIIGDRGYFGFQWFKQIKQSGAFFVSRAKNFAYLIIEARPSDHPQVIHDWIVQPTGKKSEGHYPHPIRLITFYDPEMDREFCFITNLMDLAPQEIAHLYKMRWEIEVFFRELKHYLKLSTFLGNSFNAIAIQVYCYAIAYILLKVARENLQIDYSWHRFLELMKSCATVMIDFNNPDIQKNVFKFNKNQLSLFTPD
jgi:hypothetical protein